MLLFFSLFVVNSVTTEGEKNLEPKIPIAKDFTEEAESHNGREPD